jgi:hypothetical protein
LLKLVFEANFGSLKRGTKSLNTCERSCLW